MQKNDRSNPTRVYSSIEKKRLVKALLDVKDSVTWTNIYSNLCVPGSIPSRRTLYRIFENPDSFQIRDLTAQQIENLLLMLQNFEADLASRSAQMRDAYSALRGLSGVTREHNIQFLETFAGCYRCLRLTTASRQVLVTHLEIRSAPGYVPKFSHIEVVPDEADALPSRARHRTIRHEGYVLPLRRRATFVSFEGGVRQMSCLMTTNKALPGFTGLLVTTDATNDFPFAARIILEPYRDISEEALYESQEHGLFSPKDDRFTPYIPYIKNTPKPLSALFPEITI